MSNLVCCRESYIVRLLQQCTMAGNIEMDSRGQYSKQTNKSLFFLSYFKTKSSGHFDMNRFVASCKQTYTWLVGMNQKFIVNEQRLIFLVICHYISFLNNKKHAKTFNPGCYVICWKLHVVTFSRFARPVELK